MTPNERKFWLWLDAVLADDCCYVQPYPTLPEILECYQ